MAKRKAKRKVTSPKRRTARDFLPNIIDLGDGLKIKAKLRVGGMLYLEDKYNCPLNEMPLGTGRIAVVIDLLVAMLIGESPDTPVAELEAIVKAVDVTALAGLNDQLSGVLKTSTKDLPKKNEAKEPAPN